MKNIILLILWLCLLHGTALGTIRYVKQGGSGNQNGTSWANASNDLQAMMNASLNSDQVWVAGGTYKPSATGNRSQYFDFKLGIIVLGSFAGTETSSDQRIFDTAHVSILSGDLNGDDTPNFGNRSDNSSCVVKLDKWERGKACHIDGFVIKGGYHKKGDSGNFGGGMYLWGSPHIVLNCIFWDNYSNKNGGGASVNYHYTNNHEWNMGDLKFEMPPIFMNCYFIGNKTDGQGGGLYYDYLVSTDYISLNVLSFASTVFSVYTLASGTLSVALLDALLSGGAQQLALKYFVKEIFVGQLQSVVNGMIITGVATYVQSFNPDKTNFGEFSSPSILAGCIFSNNSAGKDGGGLWTNTSNSIVDCAFKSNYSANKGGGVYSCSGGPGSFKLSVYAGESGWPAPDGMYVNRCTFKGNTAKSYGGGIYTEISTGLSGWDYFGGLAGVLKKIVPVSTASEYYFNCEFSGNHVEKKNGAGLYASLKNVHLTNCSFAGNRAKENGGGLSLSRSHSEVKNGLFFGDRADHHTEIYKPPVASSIKVYNTIVQGGFSGSGNTHAIHPSSNVSTTDVFVAPVSYNAAPNINGDYHIKKSGIAWNAGSNQYITDINSSNNDNVSFDTRYDLDKGKRIAYCTVDVGAHEAIPSIVADQRGVVYVNINAAPGGNGSSWSSAVKELADVFKEESGCDAFDIKEIWVAEGTYKPKYSADILDPNSVTGRSFLIRYPVKIFGGFAGNETLRSQRNWLAHPTILDGQQDATNYSKHIIIYHLLTGTSPELNGFILKNGRATGNNVMILPTGGQAGDNNGGAIHINTNAHPTISNCEIRDNTASNTGGAIAIADGSNSGINLVNCNIHNNGTIPTAVPLRGGVLSMGQANAYIFNCTFKNNKAQQAGGALQFTSGCKAVVANCLFSANIASATTANGSINGGGAINADAAGEVNILNSNFINNHSGTFGGAVQGQPNTTNTWLKNSIVWGNTQNMGAFPINDQVAHVINVRKSIIQGGFIGGNGQDILDLYPQFIDSVNSNYRLLTGSPAINAGNTSFYIASYGAPGVFDLSDSNRIEGCSIDMGAYEHQEPGDNAFPAFVLSPDNDGTVYVDSSVTASGNGSSWQEAVKDLADAVRLSQLDLRVKKLKVAQGTYYPKYSGDITNCSGGIIPYGDKTFVQRGFDAYVANDTLSFGWFGGYPSGGGPDSLRDPTLYPTILDGKDSANHVVVKLMYNISEDTKTYIDGFTIRGGNANGGGVMWVNGNVPVPGNNGAGIYVKAGRADIDRARRLFINHCRIEHNNALNNGGGIFIDTVFAKTYNLFTDNEIINNHAGYSGGGIYIGTFLPNAYYQIINRCRLSGNQANSTNGKGGAVCIDGANLDIDFNIYNSLFAGNRAGNGGGLYSNVRIMSLVNNTFTGNNANTHSAFDIKSCFCSSISRGFSNSIVWGNSNPATAMHIQADNSNFPCAAYSIMEGYTGTDNHNLNQDPLFTNPLPYSLAPTDSGNYHISNVLSPAFNNADNIVVTSPILGYTYYQYLTRDIESNPRISACIADRGAYEYQIRPDANGVLYVDSSNTAGTGDGSSWINAIRRLADAIEFLKCNPQPKVTTIKVAKGTYYPIYMHAIDGTPSSDNHYKNFYIFDSIKIEGGYPSGGAGTIARNYDGSPVLPVLLDGNNAGYQVLIAGANNITLDGLHITGGLGQMPGLPYIFPNMPPFYEDNSAILVKNRSGFQLNNCSVSGCHYEYGTVMFIQGNGGNPVGDFSISNCKFQNNTAHEVLLTKNTNSLLFSNNKFTGNTAFMQMHLYHNPNNLVKIINSSYTGNKNLSFSSGIFYNDEAPTDIINSTFSGNDMAASGALFHSFNNSGLFIYNSLLYNNNISTFASTALVIKNSVTQGGAYTAYGSSGNTNIDPVFVSPRQPSQAPTSEGNYALHATSPSINKGNNLDYYKHLGPLTSNALHTKDLFGLNRIIGCNIEQGAYEYLPIGENQAPITPDEDGTLYVDSSVYAGHTGNTWSNAIKDLATALRYAYTGKTVKRILVAQGTYYPKYDTTLSCNTDTRNHTFYIPEGIQIIGGYPNGGGTRQPALHPAVLSGQWAENGNTQHAFHVLTMTRDSALMDGFMITGGKAIDTGYNSRGGGVIISKASTVLHDILFYANTAMTGGGLYVAPTIGGKLPLIDRCYFLNDTAIDGGGAIHLENGIVQHCLFANNYSGNAGGAALIKNATITNSVFSGNLAEHGGGGLMLVGDGTDTANAVISSLISGNRVNDGDGGGLLNLSGTFWSINNTISGNYASSGGGLGGFALPVFNTIIWGNEAAVNSQTDNNDSTFYWKCLVQGGVGSNMLDAAPGFYNPIPGSQAPTLLGNYHIGSCSPAYNTGMFLSQLGDGATDLDGFARSIDSTVGIGAYQVSDLFIKASGEGVVYVDSSRLTFGDGSSWEFASNSLADALLAAQKDTTIHVIKVAKGTYLPWYNAGDTAGCTTGDIRDRAFCLAPNLAIYGGYPTDGGDDSTRNPWQHTTTLSGNLSNATGNGDNCYHVLIAAGALTNSLVNGFTVKEGNANGIGNIFVNGKIISRQNGGGIYITGGNTTKFEKCIIENNQAQTFGGGLYTTDSSQAGFNNCILDHNNVQSYGGGVSNSSYAAPSFFNCIFSMNQANNGGAMGNYSNAHPIIKNSTFFSNHSIQWGAALDNEASTSVVIQNSIFSYNTEGAGTPGGITGGPSVQHSLVLQTIGIFTGTANINESPLFADTANLKGNDNRWGTADDGLRLNICSPAINAGGNNALIPEDTLDITGAQRIRQQGVDMGAYENDGFVLDTLAGNSVTANGDCGNIWKYFYQAPDKLIAAIKGTFSSASLTVSGHLTPQYGSGGIVPMNQPFGQNNYYYPMNRSWQVQSAATPAEPVAFRFYFDGQDSTDIAASYPFGSLQQLIVYKIAGTDAYNTVATGFRRYTFSNVADTSHFSLGTYQGMRYAELLLPEFSSGTLALESGTPLAIRLSLFELHTDKCDVMLCWQSAEEHNASHFEVQYSTEGKHFKTLSTILAKGSGAAYEYSTEQYVNRGYYRLSMIDKDGAAAYSPVLTAVTKCERDNIWAIAPNPLTEGAILKLEIAGDQVHNAMIRIIDISGKQVGTYTWSVHQGLQEKYISFRDLAAGTYTIRLTDDNGDEIGINQKVIKK